MNVVVSHGSDHHFRWYDVLVCDDGGVGVFIFSMQFYTFWNKRNKWGQSRHTVDFFCSICTLTGSQWGGSCDGAGTVRAIKGQEAAALRWSINRVTGSGSNHPHPWKLAQHFHWEAFWAVDLSSPINLLWAEWKHKLGLIILGSVVAEADSDLWEITYRGHGFWGLWDHHY